MKYIILIIMTITTLNAVVNIPSTISTYSQAELENVNNWGQYEDIDYNNVDKSTFTYENIEYRLHTPKTTIDDTEIIIYIGDAYNTNKMGDNFASYLTHKRNCITYYIDNITSNDMTKLEDFIKTIKNNTTKKVIAIGNITGSYLLMNYIDNTNYFDKVILISMFGNHTEGDTYNLMFSDSTFYRDREHQINYNHLKEVPVDVFLEDKTVKNTYTSLPDVMFITGTKDFAYSDTLRTSNYMEHQFINDTTTYVMEGMWTNFIQHDIPEKEKLLIQIENFISN